MGKVPGTQSQGRGPAWPDKPPPLGPAEFMSPDVIGGGSTLDEADTSAVLAVPSLLMRTLLRRARESKLPLTLDPMIERRLNGGGVHQISRAREITEVTHARDTRAKFAHWIRAHVRLSLADAPGNGWEEWLDFDAEFFGKLLEAAERDGDPPREKFDVPEGQVGRPTVQTMPRWAGSHGFAPVYTRTAEIAQMHAIQHGQTEISVRQVMAVTEASLLADAHVLRIDPEQVAVLPEWESPQEAFDYAAEAVLPFDPLFLDFTGPGGLAPVVGEWPRGTPLALSGALVWRQHSEMAAGEKVVMVAPFGWPSSISGSFFDPSYEISRWESPGWFAFGAPPREAETGKVVYAGQVALYVGGTDLHGDAATCWADVCAGVPHDAPLNLPGFAIEPFPFATVRQTVADEGRGANVAADTLAVWGRMIYLLAEKALAALSITEAVEVEFVDAPMEKRDRKRAVKRGWPIAQQVVIRSHAKRYHDAHLPSGEEAHYSHRFWRRATTAHYPLGTRMADARPDLVTPCKREPERNCGFCRKVKRPAHIVGPEDKPLVLKTLVRKK